MTTPTTTAQPFELHSRRGPFNAVFFRVMGPSIDRSLHAQKARVFAGLPDEVVEIGPGVGANLPYLTGTSLTGRSTRLIAIEPNLYMHPALTAAAHRAGVTLDLRPRSASDTGLPDSSVDAVISSLVMCSVTDPADVLAEIRRILRPGGTFRFVEHVVARPGTLTRLAQRMFRRPWGWTFEGCSCERDLEAAIRSAGFASVAVERFRIHSPFVTFNPQIAGIARA